MREHEQLVLEVDGVVARAHGLRARRSVIGESPVGDITVREVAVVGWGEIKVDVVEVEIPMVDGFPSGRHGKLEESNRAVHLKHPPTDKRIRRMHDLTGRWEVKPVGHGFAVTHLPP